VTQNPQGEWIPTKKLKEGSPMHDHRNAHRRLICQRSGTKGIICYYATLEEMDVNKYPIRNSCWKRWRDSNPKAPLPNIDGEFNVLEIDLPGGEEAVR
jgi:hypothetical protein